MSFESEHRNLVELAIEVGEQEVQAFTASRGPWYGFNGRYVYLVTGESLWRSRSGLRSTVGGEPSVKRWPLVSCHATLKGDRAMGRRFVEALRLFSHLANVGDVRSLVIHPASTTHFRMDDAALAAAGIGEGTLRLSIGLEDTDDLIADLKSAFRAAQKS